MEPTDAERSLGAPGALPRRGVLGGASALAAGDVSPPIPIGGAVPPARARASGPIVAYVGAYTDGGKASTSSTSTSQTARWCRGRSWTACPVPRRWPSIRPGGTSTPSTRSPPSAAPGGSVTALAVDPASGDLRIINAVSSQGAGPAHLSVDPSGRYVFAANYGGGGSVVLPSGRTGRWARRRTCRRSAGPWGRSRRETPPRAASPSRPRRPPRAHGADRPRGAVPPGQRPRHRPHLQLRPRYPHGQADAGRAAVRAGLAGGGPAPLPLPPQRALALLPQRGGVDPGRDGLQPRRRGADHPAVRLHAARGLRGDELPLRGARLE